MRLRMDFGDYRIDKNKNELQSIVIHLREKNP